MANATLLIFPQSNPPSRARERQRERENGRERRLWQLKNRCQREEYAHFNVCYMQMFMLREHCDYQLLSVVLLLCIASASSLAKYRGILLPLMRRQNSLCYSFFKSSLSSFFYNDFFFGLRYGYFTPHNHLFTKGKKTIFVY